MNTLYYGEYVLSAAQIDGSNFLIPLYARKTGYGPCLILSIEDTTVRITNNHSILGVKVELLRIYLNYT
jgi:hypothetical protein